MPITFDGNIKLSVPETAGRSIHTWDLHAQELSPEEPPQSIESYDGGLQTLKSEPIKSCSAGEFVPCPKEKPESIRSCDVNPRIQKFKSEALKRIRSPITDERVYCTKGMLESVKTCNVGSRIRGSKTQALKNIRSPITECTDLMHKLCLRVKLSKMLSNLYLDCHSSCSNPPRRQPASRPFIISLYSELQKLDAFYRDLFSASCFYSWLLLKLLLLSLFQGTASEAHSLIYYHSGVLQQDDCPFKFEAVGFVNDQQIDKYDHNTKRNVPVAPWMGNHEDKSYWDRETNYRQGWEKVFKDNLRILRHRLNDSSIFLTLQLTYGCERKEDGNVSSRYQYALNGRDFLSLDDKSLLWQPAMHEAQISADRWNTDPVIAKSVKNYLTQHCTNALEKYIILGKEELTKRVRPEVKVWGRTLSDGVTRLQCLVYGFHPRAVDVKWMKNGVDHVPSDERTPILPHPDGTYQMRVGVEVPTTEEDAYSCHVEHSSFGETLTAKWEPNKYNTRVRAALLSVSLTSVIAVIFLIKLLKGRRTPKFYSTGSVMNHF